MSGSIWDRVLSRVETKVTRHIFYTWFKPTSLVADDGHQVRVRVPNPLFKDWLTRHYSLVLAESFAEVSRTAMTELGASFFTGANGHGSVLGRTGTQQFGGPDFDRVT